MKLTRNTEWAIIAALIAYLAFTPGFQVVKDALATPVGKAVVLAVIVYVWKFVSPIIAILLTISFLRCAKWNVWEMFSGAETDCTCENPTATWDATSKTCKDATGNDAGAVKSCICANGYAWDGGEKGTKQCVPTSGTQPPVPPPAANPAAEALAAGTTLGAAAPATPGPAAPSPVPMTTPSVTPPPAAPAAPATGGVQPGAGTTSVSAPA
jgi:hypothetical protein